MNVRGAGPGALGDLHHQLDQCLAVAGRPPARAGAEGGLLFDVRQDREAAAFVCADGGVQLVACPGYLSADALQALHDADVGHADGALEAQHPLERLARDLVSRWRDARAAWSISVDRWDGAVHLSMRVSGLFEAAGPWDGHLPAFERAFQQWEGRLRPEPAGGVAGVGRHAVMDAGCHLVRG